MAEKDDLFFDRQLSWIEFNARVFAEASDPSNPVLERLKFLGIVSANFDEFFMVRMASLEQSKSPLADKVRQQAYALMEEQQTYFEQVLVPELESHGICRIRPEGLNEKQREFVKKIFTKELFPVLTPIALSPDKQIPMLANQGIFLVLGLVPTEKKSAIQYAVVEIPKNFPRMLALPSDKGYQFILLGDLIVMFAKDLFDGYDVVTRGMMRLTRGTEMTLNEESEEDFAKVMTEALRARHSSEIMRLEFYGDDAMLNFLTSNLKVTSNKIFKVKGWFDLKGISQLAFQPIFEDLKRPVWIPKVVPAFEEADSIWDLLKKKDVWVHHPYQSFDYVVNFLAEAARDPSVLAIKQTLYRTGSESAIVSALEKAIENGKRVTVLVELKARFDEEKNITWARRLEIAGATVIYGVAGLKTHAKACLIVRREPEGIRRYVHLSTGNYNEKTAHIYTDIGFFSSNEILTNDVTTFFNMITGYSQPLGMSRITVAPFALRQKLKQLVQREILRSTSQTPGVIMAKMNSLVDPDLIETLYKASKAGVKIFLNVRGVCCLRPGVKGLSENIEVRSIVDMFLEHSRIFYFQNGGNPEVYLASADWMPRNLDRRIEMMFSVEDSEIRSELTEILKLYFRDNVKAWHLLPDGHYEKMIPSSEEKRFRIQEHLCRKAEQQEEIQKKSLPRELKPQKPRHE